MGEYLRPGEAEVLGGKKFEEGATTFPGDRGESLEVSQYEQGDMNPIDGLSRAELLAQQQATVATEQHTEGAEENTQGTKRNTEEILHLLKEDKAATESRPEQSIERRAA